jgi:hypothetical protein
VILTHDTQVSHADLVSFITPFNRDLHGPGVVADWLDSVTGHGGALLAPYSQLRPAADGSSGRYIASHSSTLKF